MKFFHYLISILFFPLLFTACTHFVEVPPPVNSVSGAGMYSSDATAISVLNGIYSKMMAAGGPAGGTNGIALFTGLSGDELTLYGSVPATDAKFSYYINKLSGSGSTTPGTELWSQLYSIIFTCNSAMDGLKAASTLSPAVRKQLLGEAHFMRAFCYFYLVNLYGDVLLPLSADYNSTASLPRTAVALVYAQIEQDLFSARSLLSASWLNGALQPYIITPERLRPTSWAATALLARVELYMGHFADAEAQATTVIRNTSLFSLVPLSNVFQKNSAESIWQLQPVTMGYNTEDARMFLLSASGPNTSSNPVYLSAGLRAAFDSSDKRSAAWIGSVTVGGGVYHFPAKYKAGVQATATDITSLSEYFTVLRLAELYLIRSEACAHQNNLAGARADLNIIRDRAFLPAVTATDSTALLTAIFRERRLEFFSEWGHRWLDLKRSGQVDSVMAIATPLKGGHWTPDWALYPLPSRDIQNDSRLIQNPGY